MNRGGIWSGLLGLVALLGAFVRMGGLVRPSDGWPPWEVVLGAAFILGTALVVIGRTVRLRLAGTAALVVIVVAAVMGRMVDPSTMAAGVLPTLDTWTAMSLALAEGLEFLRYGTAPLFPHDSFVLLLFPAFAVVGAAWAWLLADGRGMAAAVVPAGLYFAVAIADQDATSVGWLLATVVWVGALLAVSAREETAALPRVLGTPGRSGAVVASAVVVLVALVATDVTAGAVPAGGAVPWRQTSALSGPGGVSINLFASEVQTDLVSRSEDLVFRAKVVNSPTPADRLYWPMITLDRYDGRHWEPSWPETRPVDDKVLFERPDHRYRGETALVTGVVQIEALRQTVLPVLYSVRDIEGDSPLIRRGLRARDDGALLVDGQTRRGLEYRFESEIPIDSLVDVARGADGTLPPLYQAAQSAGALDVPAGRGTGTTSEPVDLARFTELPDDLDPGVSALARSVTDGATTPIERLNILETYFRANTDFTYDAEIDPGHAADDLAAWLLDPESPNYHTGYCEQFATAMGVMARSLGIPTRLVLGFTPGELNANGEIEVRGRNAHAWVEAWLEGIGWVRFDPTPRGEGDNPATTADLGGVNIAAYIPDDIENPMSDLNPGGGPIIFNPDRVTDDPFLAGDVPTPDFEPEGGTPEPTDAEPFTLPPAVWWVLVVSVLALAIPVGKWLRRRRRLAAAREGDISAAWAEITDRLRDLDRPVAPSMTPDEIAAATGTELVPLASAHARARWGGTPPGPAETDRALVSFDETHDALRRSSSWSRRMLAAWRPRSLMRP